MFLLFVAFLHQMFRVLRGVSLDSYLLLFLVFLAKSGQEAGVLLTDLIMPRWFIGLLKALDKFVQTCKYELPNLLDCSC